MQEQLPSNEPHQLRQMRIATLSTSYDSVLFALSPGS